MAGNSESQIVELLLEEEHCHLDVVTAFCEAPMFFPVSAECLYIFAKLIGHRVDGNLADLQAVTVLICAAMVGHKGMVHALLDWPSLDAAPQDSHGNAGL